MGGRRKRVRWGLRILRVTGVGLVVAAVWAPWRPDWSGSGQELASQQRGEALAVARPRHLESTYVAPNTPTAAIGRLRIPRLGVDTSVVPVGWDGDTMAVPNDVGTVGWFEPSAHLADLAGVSLLAGHVSDASDRPGAFAALARVKIGDVVEWQGEGAVVTRFRVIAMRNYPRAVGLSPDLFPTAVRHVLQLVTCANRQASQNGFHYVDNLVVTAEQV